VGTSVGTSLRVAAVLTRIAAASVRFCGPMRALFGCLRCEGWPFNP
jgi:hypothetical protein